MMQAWLAGTKTVTRRLIKPPYLPGETVYIKEKWATPVDDPDTTEIGLISYPASELLLDGHWKIKSPRFMPEWASRSHAEIISVRPEKIREITERDVMAEGIHNPGDPDFDYMMIFWNLWDSLHPGSWDRNDWVWRIELRKVEK
jgi:hypothetical protein